MLFDPMMFLISIVVAGALAILALLSPALVRGVATSILDFRCPDARLTLSTRGTLTLDVRACSSSDLTLGGQCRSASAASSIFVQSANHARARWVYHSVCSGLWLSWGDRCSCGSKTFTITGGVLVSEFSVNDYVDIYRTDSGTAVMAMQGYVSATPFSIHEVPREQLLSIFWIPFPPVPPP